MDLAILRGICGLQAEKTFFHGILGEEQLGGASADEEQLGRCPKPNKGQTKRDEVPAPSHSFRVQLFGASSKPLFAPPTFP